MDTRKNLINIFKLNGLTIRSDGVKYLITLLQPLHKSQHEQWIEKIIDSVQKLSISSPIINQEQIQLAAETVKSSEGDRSEDILQVIDVYKVPKWTYSIERKKFILAADCDAPLHCDAAQKSELFKKRYTILNQRTINHELFRPASEFATSQNKNFNLVKIEYLMSLTNKVSNLVVLGLLTELVELQYHLEDDTGAVKLDLSNAKFHFGLFSQNCFVLVEGFFEDGVLHATAVGLPPPESANTTRALVGNVNYFGGHGSSCSKYSSQMKELEAKNSGAMIVFISDLWLDDLEVMGKLETLLRGFSTCPPAAFVFCGNFLSKYQGNKQANDLKCGFSNLAEIINKFPEMSDSKFVFVGGPYDPCPANIYPRPPLPNFITADFKAQVENCTFASNPCRILYCTKEIVVFRAEIFTKMCRNSIYFPAESTADIASHFARTIISEAHLSPLPLHTLPIYWSMDHCLALHPTPDLIVTADRGHPFTTSYNSAHVINPGSFAKHDFSFKVYLPSQNIIEESQIG